MPVPGDPANSVYVSIGLDANAGGRPGPVDGSGDTYVANYESLGAWQTARLRDLQVAGETEIVECYDDWPSGLNDNFDMGTGWNGGSSDYVILRSALGEGPTNVPEDGFYLIGGARTLRVYSAFTRVYRIGIVSTTTGTSEALTIAYPDCFVDQCFVRGGTGRAIRISNPRNTVRNNFVLAKNATAADGISIANYACYVLNNTVIGGEHGIAVSRANIDAVVKNNVCYDAAIAAYELAAGQTNGGNVDDDGSSPDSVYTITDPATEFVASDGSDMHLLSGSGIRGKAEDLSGDPNKPFDYDIDGDTRAAWDSGADEFQGGVPIGVNAVMVGTNF